MFVKNLNISLLLDFYGDVLTDRQKDMLDMYYNDDFSLSEIADFYKISRQGVRSVLKKGEIILSDMEEKLNLAKRFIDVQDKSAQIALKLENINLIINNKEINDQISSLIDEIKELSES